MSSESHRTDGHRTGRNGPGLDSADGAYCFLTYARSKAVYHSCS